MVEITAEHRGVVEDITLRHTVIRTWENRRVIIPNAVIGEATIVNSTIEDEATCQWVEIGISYERRTSEELESGVPKVSVRMVRITDSSLVLRAYVWAIDPVQARVMHFELNRTIKLHFDREGIILPYPQRTVTFKGPGVPKELMSITNQRPPAAGHEEGV